MLLAIRPGVVNVPPDIKKLPGFIIMTAAISTAARIFCPPDLDPPTTGVITISPFLNGRSKSKGAEISSPCTWIEKLMSSSIQSIRYFLNSGRFDAIRRSAS